MVPLMTPWASSPYTQNLKNPKSRKGKIRQKQRSRGNLNPKPMKSNFILKLRSFVWMLRKRKRKTIKNDIESENFYQMGPKFLNLYTTNPTRTDESGWSKMFLPKESPTRKKNEKFIFSIMFFYFLFLGFLINQTRLREKQNDIFGSVMFFFSFIFLGFLKN